jgi:DNA-binding LytR/AlgR family response regulator
MNTIIAGFIGPQEIIIIIVFIGLPIFFVIWAINKAGKSRQKSLSSQLSKQFNKFRESPISKKEIKEYYPVKEGNKIILIRFDEIVDFSASNNYIFLTDITGKEYLVDVNLIDLEAKLPKDFIRVHKSTIINSKLIQEVKKLGNGRFDLIMKCEKERVISCSKNYNEKVKTIIDF